MSAAFIGFLNVISASKAGENSTYQQCDVKSTHYNFYQFALIPAALITLSFAFTKQRKNMLQSLWNGRPGLIFPMDTMTRSYRLSYACAFGTTASLVYGIAFDRGYAFRFQSNDPAARVFATILSMGIYGLVFFPLFASLAVGSVYGYAMGTLYTWMLTAMEIYRFFECPVENALIRVLSIFRGLPAVVCLLYLSVVLPQRAWRAYKEGQYFVWREDSPATSSLTEIRISHAGQYVCRLFQKTRSVKLPHKLNMGRVSATLLTLYHRFIYKRKRGFCYPTRIISALFVSLIVIYMLTFESLAWISPLFDVLADTIKKPIESTPDKDQAITRLYWMTWQFFVIWKVLLILSTIVTFILSVVNVLQTLTSYRAHMSALYRGDHSHIPHAVKSACRNTLLCRNSIRFAGYQAGNAIWGYIILWMFFALLSVVAAFLIALLIYDYNAWLITFLQWLWPLALSFILMITIELLLSRFVFLQERASYLALDNRGMYFNFTYFMFFYNVFVGIVMCLLRVGRSLVLGVFFMGRLDYSILPHRFEFLDPGFNVYKGFMQMEAAHTHPVMTVFCRLLLLGLKERRPSAERDGGGGGNKTASSSSSTWAVLGDHLATGHQPSSSSSPSSSSAVRSFDNPITTDIPPPMTLDPDTRLHRRSAAACFKWHLAYTLLRNKDLRTLRREALKQTPWLEERGVSDCQQQIYVNIEPSREDLGFAQQSSADNARASSREGGLGGREATSC